MSTSLIEPAPPDKRIAVKRYFYLALVFGTLFVLSVDCKHSDESTSHDDAFTKDDLLVIQGADVKHTFVNATLDEPIENGRNAVWCGTFQLAWNETCALLGEDLHFDLEPPMVAALNKQALKKDYLDPACYIALAGYVKDGIHQKILQFLQNKFGGAARPQHLPPESLTPRSQDIVAYAYLFKNLEFPAPFERLSQALHFGYRLVPAFGMHEPKRSHEQMAAQTLILDYNGPDDFVIELKTKSPGDRLIMAKVQPKTSLAGTVDAVKSRCSSAKPQTCLPEDELAVPKLNFDIFRQYNEIEGKRLIFRNPTIAGDLQVQSAMQDIRFQMDEKGVRLKSESHVTLACAQIPLPSHVMIFDKPFLILLERVDTQTPYFVMWIANPELFVSR